MNRIEKTAMRGYIRQATFLTRRGRTQEAMELIYFKAKQDTDISKDGYDILSAICDGIADYDEMRKENA